MTRSSTPRRIPTEEIEVGRWYRVEDAVPDDGMLRLECAVVFPGDDFTSQWLGRLYDIQNRLLGRGVLDVAWRYNGPIPDSLPPREARPKRFVAKPTVCGMWGVYDQALTVRFRVASALDESCAKEYCALLNAGHEALEGRSA